MWRYLVSVLLIGILIYFFVSALNLSEKKLKQTDDWRKSQANILANIFGKEKYNGDYMKIDQKYFPESFNALATYYITREKDNNTNYFVCFYPQSKYHKVGTEMGTTSDGKFIEYKGVVNCNGTCLECVKR